MEELEEGEVACGVCGNKGKARGHGQVLDGVASLAQALQQHDETSERRAAAAR